MLKTLSSHLLYPTLERLVGRSILPKFETMLRYYATPFLERKQQIQKSVYESTLFASKQIPFYQRKYRNHGATIEKLQTDLRYLQDLPLIERTHVFEDGVSFFNPAITDPADIHKRNTGGSTGPSTFVFYDTESLDWTAASNLFAYSMTGKKRSDSEAHIGAEFYDTHTLKNQILKAVRLRALNRIEINNDTFDADKLRRIYDILKRHRPYLLQGHPSTLYAVAQLIHQHPELQGQKLLSAFESTGEVITEKMVELIESQCGCKVYNRYGNAEAGVIAHSREHFNELFVFDFMVYPEIQDGEVTITCLRNRFMPLIRYKTGDLAELRERPDGYALSNIVGRVHDSIQVGEQRLPTHYLQDFLDHRVGDIVEFQIHETAGAKPKLLIYPTSSERSEPIRRKVEEKWPGLFDLEFTGDFEKFIRVGVRSKFKHLVRLK